LYTPVPQVINFNRLCEQSLLRYQQTYGLVSVTFLSPWSAGHSLSHQGLQQQLFHARVLLHHAPATQLSPQLLSAFVKSPMPSGACYNTALMHSLELAFILLQGLTPGSSKDELVWAVQHHFKYQEVSVVDTTVQPDRGASKCLKHCQVSYLQQYKADTMGLLGQSRQACAGMACHKA
jgi:hypothetical protein